MQQYFLLSGKCSCVPGPSVGALCPRSPLAEHAQGQAHSSCSHSRTLWTTPFWSNVGQKSLPGISSNSLIFSSTTVSVVLACAEDWDPQRRGDFSQLLFGKHSLHLLHLPWDFSFLLKPKMFYLFWAILLFSIETEYVQLGCLKVHVKWIFLDAWSHAGQFLVPLSPLGQAGDGVFLGGAVWQLNNSF